MNSPYLLFLNRRDPIVGLAAHLAAGILALVLLTGAARAGSHAASPVAAAPSAIVQR
jgi:hypothetical protein